MSEQDPKINIAIDPICKREVDKTKTIYFLIIGHVKYYFCSAACKFAFEQKNGMRPDRKSDLGWGIRSRG